MNEIMHIVKPNAFNGDWLLHNNKKHIKDKHHKNEPQLVSAFLQLSELEVHRQVLLTDAKIVPSTNIALQNLLKKLYSLI